MDQTENSNAAELSLEEAMRRLEEITGAMEKDNLSLKEMMALYKEGKKLEEVCRQMLDQADKEIEILEAEA